MLARTASATLFVGIFATLGTLSLPASALLRLSVLGLMVGTLAAAVAPHIPRAAPPARRRTAPLRAGALAAAIFLGLYLTAAGLQATLGGGPAAFLLAVLAAAAMVTDIRHEAYRSEPDTTEVVSLPPPARPVAELSTDDLCTAWRRSYCQLLVTRDTPDRRPLVQRRQDYLDEIERRDRNGFLRWLDSGARAGSDPRPYLTPRH